MGKVLIVDNEPGILRLLERTLLADGHEVWTASGASEALKLLKEHPVDVILMDIYMPEMSGLALMKIVRQSNPKVRTILISGRHSGKAEATAKQFGAFGFVSKPFRRCDLSAMVRDALTQDFAQVAS